MSKRDLSAHGLRRVLCAGIRRVVAQRDEINRINVFPVADHDAGTNLAFTLGAVRHGLRGPCFAGAGDVMRQVAADANDGARGNSGAILAHFFQGVAEALVPGRRVTAAALGEAVHCGSTRAQAALAEPREGTILSAMRAFAGEMQLQAAAGEQDIRVCFQRALARARAALRETQNQIKVLRAVGVVDAGALGFVELLAGIGEFIERGAMPDDSQSEEMAAAGIEVFPGSGEVTDHRFCAQCVVSAAAVDRGALRAAVLSLGPLCVVLTGSRDRVRLHAHVGDPAQLFAMAARFGAVSREKTEDMLVPSPAAQARRHRVAIVADSGADLPAEAVDRLDIQVVPQRLSIGGRDFVDGVSISTREFYDQMRTSPQPPRTSQPPPGDFRRMFEFLLAHHEQVIDVSLSRVLSGTMQSATSAAVRTAADRINVFDTGHGAASQGLLTIWAAEAAQAGLAAPRIIEGLARMRARTALYAVVRDIRYAVRGGRVPPLALPLTRFLRVSLLLRIRPNGRLGLMGGLWGRRRWPERFARRIARELAPGRRYRLIVGHCDCADDAERVRAALLACGREIDRIWVLESGIAIGTHAGPGSLVIGVQDYEPPRP